MPSNPIVLRTCAGGHTVRNDDIVGMTSPVEGEVDLFCAHHAGLFEAQLNAIGTESLLLQM